MESSHINFYKARLPRSQEINVLIFYVLTWALIWETAISLYSFAYKKEINAKIFLKNYVIERQISYKDLFSCKSIIGCL